MRRAGAVQGVGDQRVARTMVTLPIEGSDYPAFPGTHYRVPMLVCGRAKVYAHNSLFIYTIATVLISLVRPRDATIVTLIVHGPVLWLSVLCHELAKALVAFAVGQGVGEIVLWPLGGLTLVGATSDLRRDVLIAIAGPLAHVPLVLVIFAAIRHSDYAADSIGSRALFGSMWLNVGLAALNCVAPAYPLDSARIIVDLQVIWGTSIPDAASLLVFFSMPCVPGLVVYGLYAIGVQSEIAVPACALAVWVGIQARLVLYVRQLHALDRHPLFAHLPHQTGATPSEAPHRPLVTPTSSDSIPDSILGSIPDPTPTDAPTDPAQPPQPQTTGEGEGEGGEVPSMHSAPADPQAQAQADGLTGAETVRGPRDVHTGAVLSESDPAPSVDATAGTSTRTPPPK
ncbi:hypothetical protein T492DRAFT_926315 [Pavlovales sp. CCMP2436]|nr:hypothetical protein T492DRAFT_926315 [Pavlovales sp. CCMP2436]